jgi:twitching motility protein PilJ
VFNAHGEEKIIMSTLYQNNSYGKLPWFSIIVLILFIGCMVVSFEYASIEDKKTQAYLAILSEQSLLSQQISASTSQSLLLKGKRSFSHMQALRQHFDKNLEKLQKIDPELSLRYKEEINDLVKQWQVYRKNIDTILLGQKVVANSQKNAEKIDRLIPDLQTKSEMIAQYIVKNTASNPDAKQILLVSRQTMLIQRIDNNLNRVLSGNSNVGTAAEQFAQDAEEFGTVINTLLNDKSIALKPAQLQVVKDTVELFANVSETVSTILDVAPTLKTLSKAAFSIETHSRVLLQAIINLQQRFKQREKYNTFYNISAIVFGVLALLMAMLLAYSLFKQARKRLQSSHQLNDQQQQAIIQLLEEMSTLAEGDLTIKATVSENITGAIADSVNYAVEALRVLVTKINNTSGDLTHYAGKADQTIQLLSSSSQQQNQKIQDSSQSISVLIDSIKNVSKSAASSAQVAEKSLKISHAGATTVRNTIAGMSTIREQIQSTSKRIKRLSESSQEISNIVHLMNDIAEQTNILALNAAIQASAAESQNNSQNFSVLSDEVQQLSQDASEATRKIEVLVRAILADTEEAVASMEVTTAHVVEGTHNAEAAKNSLNEIENVSAQLADLIENISSVSTNQFDAAEQISETINVIQYITQQTSDQVVETTQYIGDLTKTAAELRESIYGFVLPKEESLPE